MPSATMRNRRRVAGAGKGAMHMLCVSALVIACSSCGGGRSRSARESTADRERAETLATRLPRLSAPLEAESERVVPLREIVSSPAMVGRRVRVVGRCASPRSLRLPEPPARGGDAWQLEADGTTVLVVGARPRACSALAPKMLTLTVVVAEDTLAAIGDLPGAPRRYLVLVDAK